MLHGRRFPKSSSLLFAETHKKARRDPMCAPDWSRRQCAVSAYLLVSLVNAQVSGNEADVAALVQRAS